MKTETQFGEVFKRMTEICAIGAGGVAFLALLSWMFGQWPITTFGGEYIPMDPSTAYLIILFTSGVFLCCRRPAKPVCQRFALFVVFSVGGMSLLVLTQPFLGFELPLEQWLTPTIAWVGNIPVGRMSPLTAAAFLAFALAFLLELPPFARHRPWRQMASVSALGGLLISLTVLVSYAAGAPLLYGSQTIPMAVLTAVSFAFISFGLLIAAGPDTWLLMLLGAGSTGLQPSPSRRFLKGPMVVFLFLLLAIATAGYFYLAHQLAVFRRAVQETLAAIADLKAGQITYWYRERRADAEVILTTPAIQAQARQFLSTAVQAAAARDILAWMESLRQHYGYARVVLYDAQGSPRVSAPSKANPPNVSQDPDFQTALRAKGIFMTDLHRDQDAADAGQQRIHLSIWVPIGIKPGAETSADGAWLLQIDPYQFLYPLIQSWPTPSRTAETLLVRREGNYVVYLNELRYRANTALSFQFPIDRQRYLPAAMAVLGQEGVIEGRDYRDVPVLAAIRTVHGTPWFMVAKVDREEIYAPLRERAWSIGITLLISILAAALSVRWMESHRDAQQLQVQLACMRERQALAERILHLNKHANDIILLTDQHWRILEANDRALQAYGYSLEELQHMRLSDLHVPDTRVDLDRLAEQVEEQDGAIVETVHQRKDGSKFPVESSIRSVEIGGEKYSQSIIRDITERKQAQEALRRSHEQFRALSVRLHGVREEERTRIAREIHDELGQLLTGLKMDLRWMERRLEELSADPQMNPILDKIVAATELADATIKTVQRIAAELRPGILDRVGLLTTLRYESNQFQQRTGIVCRLHAPEEESRLPPATATAFFRIFQEALTNIARHSGASTVEAAFRLENGQFLLEVQDNGKGIAEDALSNLNSLGLLSMHERARALAGEVAICRGVDGGTIVTARIPQAINQAENV